MKSWNSAFILSAVCLAMIVLAIPVSCKKESAKKTKPNIVYVLVDQMRAQATGYSGDPNLIGRTPNIDRIAESGINFRNAVSVCPVCTPYRASLLTGQYPTTTGMFFNDIHLPEESLTMAEIFKKEGYSTAYIGKWHLDGMGRMAFTPPERRQGFDYWKGLECSHEYNNLPYYTGGDTSMHHWEGYAPYAKTKDAIAYIEQHAKEENPFLLFVSYAAPHFPHDTAPEELKLLFSEEEIILGENVGRDMEERARKESVGYYAHIVAIDSCIGELQKALKQNGIFENTIFVFTSDHGEMMGAHSVRPKLKQLAYAESVRIPFLLKYPAIFENENIVVNSPINTPDILPTLLDLVNITVPKSVEGISMAGAISSPSDFDDKAALIMSVSPFDNKENDEYRGIYTERYTYIENLEGPWMIFDNEEDPYQMNNLVNNPKYKDLEKELKGLLWKELNNIDDEFKPRMYYINKWGYELNEWGHIPYNGEHKFQGPGN
ncbi:MAG: sulfatase [Bacteroidales bacterium]|nr:sulfatase [Bacteroidales bacterium]